MPLASLQPTGHSPLACYGLAPLACYGLAPLAPLTGRTSPPARPRRRGRTPPPARPARPTRRGCAAPRPA
eukprot:536747-Pyramimonas_sp.AAC.1